MLTAIMPSVVMAKVVRLNVMLPIYQHPLFKIILDIWLLIMHAMVPVTNGFCAQNTLAY